VDLVERLQPDVAFLDIRMPGLSGLQAASRMARPCRIVFVTAYDQYAVEAFEAEAVDYLLKPVTAERLERTVLRLKRGLDAPAGSAPGEEWPGLMARLMARLEAPGKKEYLKWITLQHRDTVRLVSVEDVRCFRSSDKYTAVLTTDGESLINTPIRDLALSLDPDLFWRIHRGTIVNVRHIKEVSRSLTGRQVVRLKGTGETLTVSRSYSHRFKQM
jgi:DNA-binding LytR/AlgR family response regulator